MVFEFPLPNSFLAQKMIRSFNFFSIQANKVVQKTININQLN